MITIGIILIVLQVLAIASSFISGKNPFQQGIASAIGYFLIGFIGIILIIVGYRQKNKVVRYSDNNEKVKNNKLEKKLINDKPSICKKCGWQVFNDEKYCSNCNELNPNFSRIHKNDDIESVVEHKNMETRRNVSMDFKKKGAELREGFKALVYEYMLTKEECKRFGMRQSEIFRDCGMDWGEKENCTSSNQQYYIVAILRDLEEEGKIQRDLISKKWRLK